MEECDLTEEGDGHRDASLAMPTDHILLLTVDGPKCAKCGGSTSLVAFLPRFGERPAYRIFECRACKALVWIAETADP
jgi:hypothetical protein